MKKISFPAVICLAIFSLAACDKKPKQTSTTRAERDTLYNKLTDEEKRLPKNALLGLEVADNLETKLFSAEPLMGNPTNIDIDAKGRVWVCDAFNYRNEFNPDNPQRKAGDRILILGDTNGDGQADTSKVFYQGTDINAALGIAVLGNKVIVSCSPNVFVFTDSNGDDKPDKKERLFTGLEGIQHDHAVHAFTFGPDGKYYFNFGNAASQIKDKNGQPLVDKEGNEINTSGHPYRQGLVLRCNPDGSEMEVLAHNFRNNYEVAVDSYGTLWQSDNDDDGNRGVRINYVMEFGNYGYTDEMTGASWQSRRTNMEAEIPERHWHLNDPGTIPSLLKTGAGSPTGMIVYEGRLLPKTFWDQMIHCDAGPNVVRAYPVQADGAGYKAEMVNLLEGTRDQWFRPSDVCVAPDGSLIVADWYDPGVGGHQMVDTDRGRLYRIAPPETPYTVPVLDLSSPEKAADALQSPNLSIRYLAWEKLHNWGKAAIPALEKVWQSGNTRFRARALWLLAKTEGQSEKYVAQAIKDQNPDIRITALRIARQTDLNIIPYVKTLVTDPSAQVRREAAITLHHNKSPEAPQLWAELATQHDGKDRWYLEALGIGADQQWDTFFAAWKQKVGDQCNTPAGRDIVWRARTKETLPLLAQEITAAATNPKEQLRYFRAFDFQQDPSKEAVLLSLLDKNDPQITLTALNHINPTRLSTTPKLQAILKQTLASVKGTQAFLDLIQRYQVRDQHDALMQMILDQPDSSLGIESARVLMDVNGALMRKALSSTDEKVSSAILRALKRIDNAQSMDLIQSVVMDQKRDLSVRKEAVRALGTGWSGEEKLLDVVKQGQMPEELKTTAAGVLASANRKSVREEAAKFLKLPGNTEGKPLPLISQFVKQKGTAALGERVYLQNCSPCHQIGKSGINFGPALTQIGGKLSKEALYVSIIHPDAGISFGYEGFVFKMKDGNVVAGMIASQTADAIEVKMMGGVVSKYPKSDIVSRKPMESSLMPSNLQQNMTEQELVDLVEYLSTLKAAPTKQVAIN
ncbi:MAG: PVC-type heme-binding CxxCH protein [Bacteroidota bacterium]